ncbi:MAG: hypothetical protein ACRD0Q_06120 [Acidimicrobiales bacterium]
MTPERAAIAEVEQRVSAIRGLPWKAPLDVQLVSAEELARRVREFTVKDFAEKQDQIVGEEAALKLLGLVPPALDYRKTLEDLFAGGVLGFYDDETKELFVKDDTGPGLSPATKGTLAHELTHALTDQHFDFGPRLDQLDQDGRTEEVAGGIALIEGDAELVRSLYIDRYLNDADRGEADSSDAEGPSPYARVPSYLVQSLLFPYTEGLTFVESLYRRGGFGAVDAAYRAAPTSTEQILHPQRYAAGDATAAVTLPDLSAAIGCSRLETGALGEFDMRQVLRERLASADSERAAAGWDGDAFELMRCGTVPAMADRWQAESPAEATELADALARWSSGWSGSGRRPGPDGRFAGPSGSGRVLRSGNRVDLVLARDAVTAGRLEAVLFPAGAPA